MHFYVQDKWLDWIGLFAPLLGPIAQNEKGAALPSHVGLKMVYLMGAKPSEPFTAPRLTANDLDSKENANGMNRTISRFSDFFHPTSKE